EERNGQRIAAVTVAMRCPFRSSSVMIGRAAPRRAKRAASATVDAVESWACTTTAVAGGNESHSTPASAAVNGEESGRSTYQSPGWPFVGHSNTAGRD